MCITSLNAQEAVIDINVSPSEVRVPNFNHISPRPKFVELSHTFLGDYSFDVDSADSELFGPSQARIEDNQRTTLKVNLPLHIGSRTTWIGGFSYKRETLKVRNIIGTEYTIYDRIDDQSLTQIGFNLIAQHKLKDTRFFIAIVNWNLNSDDINIGELEQQLRTTVSGVYGWKPNKYKQISFGATIGYNLGRFQVLPVFMYENDLSSRWNLELIAPKRVNFRYTYSDRLFFYFGADIKGANYTLASEPLEGFNRVEFRKAHVLSFLNLEAEIYDFLWVGAKAGYQIPLNIFFAEPAGNRSDAIIDPNLGSSFFSEFSVFFVVPKKLLSKTKSKLSPPGRNSR
ncbi:MAG: DUF6268 family outer membrane beta-barrel protein [Bacteroidota bacterium]